jgi:hypothetical protein
MKYAINQISFHWTYQQMENHVDLFRHPLLSQVPNSREREREREREIYLMNQNSGRRHSRHCINLYDQNLQKDEVDSVKLRSCLHESIMYFLGVAFMTHDYRKAVIFFVLFGKPNAHKAPGIQ